MSPQSRQPDPKMDARTSRHLAAMFRRVAKEAKAVGTFVYTMASIVVVAIARLVKDRLGIELLDTEAKDISVQEVIEILSHFADMDRLPQDMDWALWDKLIKTPMVDPRLEAVRLECIDITYADDEYLFPAVRRMLSDLTRDIETSANSDTATA